ncbi:hypothetical protein [Solitalea lacus]|uniref:hypothetical protein n=1 Tax=Solitalea lacus TaxID=2911172 RepID=UPI001EDC6E99|nr:hypothetical protein [Solitalea lacus]UKJ08832.1 hypothetical protein L2B55_06600 [Solitalea lacus]
MKKLMLMVAIAAFSTGVFAQTAPVKSEKATTSKEKVAAPKPHSEKKEVKKAKSAETKKPDATQNKKSDATQTKKSDATQNKKTDATQKKQ